jgi:hypothetical protein
MRRKAGNTMQIEWGKGGQNINPYGGHRRREGLRRRYKILQLAPAINSLIREESKNIY